MTNIESFQLLAGGTLDLLGSRQKAFPLQLLAGELAGTADGLSLLARLALGGLFVMATKFHFPENALALHFFLEGLERLIDVVVANNYLHEQTFVFEFPNIDSDAGCPWRTPTSSRGDRPLKLGGWITELRDCREGRAKQLETSPFSEASID